MPRILSKEEEISAFKTRDLIKEQEAKNVPDEPGKETEHKPTPDQKKLPSLTEKVIQIIDDITNPKGT